MQSRAKDVGHCGTSLRTSNGNRCHGPDNPNLNLKQEGYHAACHRQRHDHDRGNEAHNHATEGIAAMGELVLALPAKVGRPHAKREAHQIAGGKHEHVECQAREYGRERQANDEHARKQDDRNGRTTHELAGNELCQRVGAQINGIARK